MGSVSKIVMGVAILILIVIAVIFVLRRNQKDLEEIKRRQARDEVRNVLGDEEE